MLHLVHIAIMHSVHENAAGLRSHCWHAFLDRFTTSIFIPSKPRRCSNVWWIWNSVRNFSKVALAVAALPISAGAATFCPATNGAASLAVAPPIVRSPLTSTYYAGPTHILVVASVCAHMLFATCSYFISMNPNVLITLAGTDCKGGHPGAVRPA